MLIDVHNSHGAVKCKWTTSIHEGRNKSIPGAECAQLIHASQALSDIDSIWANNRAG